VLANSWLALNAQEAFGATEISLGDCAYGPRDWVVPTYKKPSGGTMPTEITSFNTLIAKPRVSSEHMIGMLKGRYPYLQSIRLRLTEDVESMTQIQHYVAVSIILHNLLAGWDDNDWEVDEGSDNVSTTSALVDNKEN
jgi:hypothetical protein